ncbi:MAG: hypothetical protein ABSF70_14335 [Terracidiphilus sp.]
MPAPLLNETQFQAKSSMCAKTHALYRYVRIGLSRTSEFRPIKGRFHRENGHFDGKRRCFSKLKLRQTDRRLHPRPGCKSFESGEATVACHKGYQDAFALQPRYFTPLAANEPSTIKVANLGRDFSRLLIREGLTTVHGAPQTDEQKKERFWRGEVLSLRSLFAAAGGGRRGLAGFHALWAGE